jgi:hypothetical protein
VIVSPRLSYAQDSTHTLELYRPPGWRDGQVAPAVILVSGFSDHGAQRMLGCRISEMESFRSWGRLIAASGAIAMTYTTGADPFRDLESLLRHAVSAAGPLGIDRERIGLFACSGHVPNALGLLMAEPGRLRCAVLAYGFMLDAGDSTGVADAQRVWGFANPAAGKSVDDLPPDVALLVVRAGRDAFPQVNPSIDAFVAHALRRNLPLTMINHHDAPHAFDLDDDGEASREVVEEMLAFLRRTLSGGRTGEAN